jgi:glycosyltransferase involved in cell wall biosynthesis
MDKINLLLITQHIPHYRIPIYNMLNERVRLTILHSQIELNHNTCKFNKVYASLGSIGPFLYFKINLNRFCQGFDVVIYESNIRFIDRNIITISPWRGYKWVSWGIGQAASYDKRLGDFDIFKNIRMFLQKKSDASILYSSFPLSSYIETDIDSNAIFIANNTVALDYVVKPNLDKNIILFIGTLYKQKKLMELIEAYRAASERCNLSIPLVIIGEGSERNKLESYVRKFKLQNLITFLGHIEDAHILSKNFSSALACISPGQAGLSVLTSMANSVPFITREDAITGGEIFNINSDNKKTGVIYKTKDELVDLLCDINTNKSKYIEMGDRARNYYVNFRLPEYMINSIIDAIRFVMNK